MLSKLFGELYTFGRKKSNPRTCFQKQNPKIHQVFVTTYTGSHGESAELEEGSSYSHYPLMRHLFPPLPGAAVGLAPTILFNNMFSTDSPVFAILQFFQPRFSSFGFGFVPFSFFCGASCGTKAFAEVGPAKLPAKSPAKKIALQKSKLGLPNSSLHAWASFPSHIKIKMSSVTSE